MGTSSIYEISPVGDSDLFRFSGQAGDRVDILVLRYTGRADACFRVIDPDGAPGQNYCVNAVYREPTVGANVQVDVKPFQAFLRHPARWLTLLFCHGEEIIRIISGPKG